MTGPSPRVTRAFYDHETVVVLDGLLHLTGENRFACSPCESMKILAQHFRKYLCGDAGRASATRIWPRSSAFRTRPYAPSSAASSETTSSAGAAAAAAAAQRQPLAVGSASTVRTRCVSLESRASARCHHAHARQQRAALTCRLAPRRGGRQLRAERDAGDAGGAAPVLAGGL